MGGIINTSCRSRRSGWARARTAARCAASSRGWGSPSQGWPSRGSQNAAPPETPCPNTAHPRPHSHSHTSVTPQSHLITPQSHLSHTSVTPHSQRAAVRSQHRRQHPPSGAEGTAKAPRPVRRDEPIPPAGRAPDRLTASIDTRPLRTRGPFERVFRKTQTASANRRSTARIGDACR
eukprot:1185715-Prorocentrum_minimum.AAC.5